jgi:CheY-like chemotaxis protein
MKKVLVVDDNPLNRDLACAMLQRSGFAVTLADGAHAALASLLAEPVDVVLTDIGMPEVSGIELARMIHSALGEKRPRLVAFTSFAMQDEKTQILEAGFDALLIKPTTRACLTEAMTAAPDQSPDGDTQ